MDDTKKIISTWKVILPVLIGVGVVVAMFLHDARSENLRQVWDSLHFDPFTIGCVLLGFVCMFGRDFGLSWRFRALTDRQLRWSQAFKVDFLCEFTSCVTPSAVGGSSLGMVFLNSQGIEFGRATTLMMTTLLLDELFFVVFCPIIALLTPAGELFHSGGETFTHGIRLTFWLVYSGIAVWTAVLFFGIILYPKWVRSVLDRVTTWKWLRRWHSQASQLGANMVATSKELRRKPIGFWLEVFGGTSLSWCSRYLVVNALFLGFVPSADPQQWIIFAREFVMWVVLMVSPTPGGAGLSEWLFTSYYGDLVTSAGLALILAIFWRLISYYVYLIIGACIIPGWIKQTYLRFKHKGGPSTPASGEKATNVPTVENKCAIDGVEVAKTQKNE